MEKKSLNKKEPEDIEKEGIFWNTFWIFCIISSIILIIISNFFITDFNTNIKKYNINYPWPKISDLFPTLYLYRNYSIWILCSQRFTIFSKIDGWERIYAHNVFAWISQ